MVKIIFMNVPGTENVKKAKHVSSVFSQLKPQSLRFERILNSLNSCDWHNPRTVPGNGLLYGHPSVSHKNHTDPVQLNPPGRHTETVVPLS